ncbi:MAG: branched-chain amino acid aminotransferase [Ginsengibacter sp.]
MMAAGHLKITRAEESKLSSLSLDKIPFGKYFTDHMLEVDYENGEWKTIHIKPFAPIMVPPSLAALHYGQAIFEGIKAFRKAGDEVVIFRPYENLKRFNLSAKRMEMPEVPEEIFIEGMKELVKIDVNWIPDKPHHSLYIRPFMFSSDDTIGVKPGSKYKFMIILSPTGPYYSAPMKILVEEKYVRAVEGGVGFAKNAGNYGAAMFPTAEAKRKGYDQVLWTDACEHKYVQECGVMNIFFIVGKKALTPDLESGTILAGVTRDSVIQLLNDMGFTVEERKISIDELVDAYKSGELLEVFGTGTAATISMIKELKYKDFVMSFDVDKWKISTQLKETMSAIKEGRAEDKYEWMLKA